MRKAFARSLIQSLDGSFLTGGRGSFALAMLCAGMALPGMLCGQTMFSENFQSLPPGQSLPAGRWLVLGAMEGDYWNITAKGLETGDLDSYFPGLTWVMLQTPESKPWTDIQVTAKIQVKQQDGTVGLAVRVRDASNYYYGVLQAQANGSVRADILKMVGGVPRPLVDRTFRAGTRDVPAFAASGRSHDLVLSAEGENINLSLDGVSLLTTQDAELRNGSVGVGAAFNEVVFERLLVTPPGQTPSASAGSGGKWRILISMYGSKPEADQNAKQYQLGGAEELEVVQRGTGWALYMGKYATEELALVEFERMKNEEGLLLDSVEQVGGAAESATSTGTGVTRPGTGTSTGTGPLTYRVKVGESSSMDEVEKLKARLHDSGQLYVDVLTEGGVHEVMCGLPFPNRAEADTQARELRSSGFDTATVVERRSGGEGGSTRAEQDKIAEIAIAMEEARKGGPNARSQADIDQMVRGLSPEQQAILRAAQEGLDAQAKAEEEYKRLMTEYTKAADAQNWDVAVRQLDEALKLRPNDPAVINLRETARAKAREADRPTPVAPLGHRERIDGLLAKASEAEAADQLQEALEIYRNIRSLSPPSAVMAQVNDAVSRIEGELSSRTTTASPGADEDGGSGMLFIIIGGVVLLLVGGGGFVVISRKKAQPATTTKTAAAPAPVAPKPSVPATPPQRDRPTPSNRRPQRDKPTPTGALPPVEVVGDSDRIRPGVHSPAPDPPSSIPMPLDIEPPLEEARVSSGEVPLEPDVVERVHQSPPSGVVPVDNDVYYVQDFEDEEVGKPPKRWKGEYDYASLVVSDKDVRPGSTKCLRFEKKHGTGSAYYACRFPDASGKVCVEFDLRCDDKNKYLLGFYIEKDEDFRHSIHTVVHKDMSKKNKVTLRLQNESFNYNLGEWVRIKFLIDLPRNLVDGFVNDEAVAVGVRLASRPKVINTLSIRDNLATEGVLLIDNIRITRDR